MAQKNHEKGVTGAAPVVTGPDRVRNVVLVGHSGAGKTTLVEALLAATGTIGRAGAVADGTTVGDHDPAAVRQQRSVSLSCAPLLHNGIKVNLLDTPGYGDFIGELAPGDRVGALQESYRVLRPAGRIHVIQRAARGGIGAIFSRGKTDSRYAAPGGPERALDAEGFRSVRVLAEREGLIFIEGLKPRS